MFLRQHVIFWEGKGLVKSGHHYDHKRPGSQVSGVTFLCRFLFVYHDFPHKSYKTILRLLATVHLDFSGMCVVGQSALMSGDIQFCSKGGKLAMLQLLVCLITKELHTYIIYIYTHVCMYLYTCIYIRAE